MMEWGARAKETNGIEELALDSMKKYLLLQDLKEGGNKGTNVNDRK